MEDKKKTEARHQQILMDLLKQPENRVCCDCPEKGPRWASWNIGCFVCLRCAGIHRRMGTHVSKVKSVTLDTWTEEQIESIRSKGNAIVNAQYNPNPDRHPPPPLNDDAAHEQYIRDKYERKLFTSEMGGRSSGIGSSSSSSSQHQHHGLYSNELRKLRDMGFTDMQANVTALKKTGGDVNGAVNILINESKPGTPANSNLNLDEQRMVALKNMGFKDEQSNRRALQQTNGDIQAAVQLLMKNSLGNTTAAATPSLGAPPSSKAGAVAAPVATKTVNLLGDDDPFGAPVAAPAASTSNGGFGDFTTTSSATVPASNSGLTNDLFGDFGGAPAGGAAAASKASKNDILSLFSSPAAPAAAPTPFAAPSQPYGAPQPGYGMPQAQPGFGAPAHPGFGAPAPGFGSPMAAPAYAQPNPYIQPGFGAPMPAMQPDMFGRAGGVFPQPVQPFGQPPYARPPMGANPYGAPAPAMGGYGQPVYNPFGGSAPAQPTAFGAPAAATPSAANPFSQTPAAKPANTDPFASIAWK